MKIIVVDFAAKTGGAISILQSFYHYLVDSCDKNEWLFLLNDHYIKDTSNIKTIILKKEKKSWWNRLVFDLFLGRKLVRELNADAIFYLQNTLIRGVHIPQIMYMDQSLSFQKEKQFSFFKRDERIYAIYQYIIGKLNHEACKKAEYTIVQTEWLKKAIKEQCNILDDRVIKISPNESLLCRKYHAETVIQTEFFYPASNAIYKNHLCIYEALSQLEESCNVVLTIPNQEGLPKQCKCIGSISPEEVYSRMENSILLFPSYIESFGLPLKEAMEIGTIILAADTLFAREILSGYENAYFFKTFCPSDLANLMRKVIIGDIVHIPQVRGEYKKEENAWEKVVRIIRSVQK